MRCYSGSSVEFCFYLWAYRYSSWLCLSQCVWKVFTENYVWFRLHRFFNTLITGALKLFCGFLFLLRKCHFRSKSILFCLFRLLKHARIGSNLMHMILNLEIPQTEDEIKRIVVLSHTSCWNTYLLKALELFLYEILKQFIF